METLKIIGRSRPLLCDDLDANCAALSEIISGSSFLVVGAGGSIGQAVCKEIFKRRARKLHAVDLSENGLVELVRDIRSQYGYITRDFETFAIDAGSDEFEFLFEMTNYDYVLNLSALKHVRSESNIATMSRMAKTNIQNAVRMHRLATRAYSKKYFCVSTDKAANPVNFMGATKRAMELCLMRPSNTTAVSTARFANVAFSNGSLLEGLKMRIEKAQPISAPRNIRRFFVTQEESGQICLLSTLLGRENEILFPRSNGEMKLTLITEIVEGFLTEIGKKPVYCESEDEARRVALRERSTDRWPVFFFDSDTTGEKPFEEFHTSTEEVHDDRFTDLSYVKFVSNKSEAQIEDFLAQISNFELRRIDARHALIQIFKDFMPDFEHAEMNKFLNQRM